MLKMITSPLKAIKEFCLEECCCGQYQMMKTCTKESCPLFNFRFGKNPFSKRELTEEQRQASAERLRRAREAKNT